MFPRVSSPTGTREESLSELSMGFDQISAAWEHQAIVGGRAALPASTISPSASIEPVINLIPLESKESAGVWPSSTLAGWATRVRLAIRAT